MTMHKPRPRATHVLAAQWLLFTSLPAAALDGGSGPATTVATVQFNAQFLKRPDGTTVDVSRFANGNPVSPGDYPVDIYVNGAWIARETVRFQPLDTGVAPCMDGAVIARLNLDDQALPSSNRNAIARAIRGQCTQPSAISADIGW